MLLYSLIVLPVAVLIGVLSKSIYNGKIELIHEYHYTEVTDKEGYCKGFGKSLAVIAAGIFISGIVGLLGDSDFIAMLAVVILFAGIFIGLYKIYKVQKKYNSGIF